MDYIISNQTLLKISIILVCFYLISVLLSHRKKPPKGKNQKKKMAGISKLKCAVKNYEWGKIGSKSEVYRLYKANCGENNGLIDVKKKYAEFWMGTHVGGPSYISSVGPVHNARTVNNKKGNLVNMGCKSLKNLIENYPFVVGDKVLEKWGCDLPFLFKVLSVAKPLSIQAHPCKELAEKLHVKYPTIYKDGNHKPEMALAISKFEMLCGFIAIEDLRRILDTVPEISQLVGSAVVDRVMKITPKDGEEVIKGALRQLFTQIMSASDHVIAEVLSHLISRLRKKVELTSEENLVLRLEELYPRDVGVLAAFLMNYMLLNPGEAVCLGANELHAYISGDCIECMATSDNVVRAGLTPKQRDVKTLCEMLTYKQGRPEILRGFNVEGTDGSTRRYRPPFEEFEVDHCDLSEGRTITFPSVAGPSLFLVTQGAGSIRAGLSVEKIGVGDVLFAPDNTMLIISSNTRLEMYRAGINSNSKFL